MATENAGYYDLLRHFSLLGTTEDGERGTNDGADDEKDSGHSVISETHEVHHTLIKNALVWIDLEMTGLDLEKDTILEIAVIITDGHLRRSYPGPEFAIHHDDTRLADMNEWSLEHHALSGLTGRCRISETSMQEAETAVVAFVEKFCDSTTSHHLAGSSVHVDLAFLRLHMPALAALLPFRVVDVSTVLELCRRWYPKVHRYRPRTRKMHTARADIEDSIAALQWLQQRIFR